jgi:hypothetical protein
MACPPRFASARWNHGSPHASTDFCKKIGAKRRSTFPNLGSAHPGCDGYELARQTLAITAASSRRSALITPYYEDLTAAVAKALEGEGRQVVAAHGIGIAVNVELSDPEPHEIVEFARSKLGDRLFDIVSIVYELPRSRKQNQPWRKLSASASSRIIAPWWTLLRSCSVLAVGLARSRKIPTRTPDKIGVRSNSSTRRPASDPRSQTTEPPSNKCDVAASWSTLHLAKRLVCCADQLNPPRKADIRRNTDVLGIRRRTATAVRGICARNARLWNGGFWRDAAVQRRHPLHSRRRSTGPTSPA